MPKSTKQLLSELAEESDEARSDMGSAKTGLKRPGEDSDSLDEEEFLDDDEEEQDLDSDEESDDELDEESDEDEDEEEESDEDEDDEEDDSEDDDDNRNDNATAAQRRINAKKDKEIERLSGLVESLQGAVDKKDQEDIMSQIGPLANRLKLNPEGLAAIIKATVDITEKRLSSKLPSSEEMARQRLRNDQAADAEYFGGEWKGFQSDVMKQYPRATAKQLEQAREKMEEIAHDPKRGGRVYVGKDGIQRLNGYPLDFLMFKYKKIFEPILSNKKRHGLESSSVADSYDDAEEPNTSTAKGIDRLDKEYRNLEASSSGIRRGRRPRNRRI